jgi:lantibiotic leader peptide-processing serine protease
MTKVNRRIAPIAVALALAATMLPVALSPSAANADDSNAKPSRERYVVIAKNRSDLDQAKKEVAKKGGKVEREGSEADSLKNLDAASVTATAAEAATIAALPNVTVIKDRLRTLRDPEGAPFDPNPTLKRTAPFTPDPASSLPGLLWTYDRLHVAKAHTVTTGAGAVVGIADTGIDYTHSELAGRVIGQADLSDTVCKDYFGASDADQAALNGVPQFANTDWNGHGSWIAGNIAANADSVGLNGIAPDAKLYDLKIAQWCGSTFDTTIVNAITFAGDHGIDVVNISFGGYLDRADPEQETLWQLYAKAVAYARSKGTTIVSSAGNDHARLGTDGLVISHGSLTIPGTDVADYFGLYEVPAGLPGVIMVSATGNYTAAASATCAAGTFESGKATCKPASDLHQPIAVGKINQLSYYSNYGPRIDIAGPGGARKFNLPGADRGGTVGWPDTTADGTTAFEDFSITSNWALEIPCFFNFDPRFYQNECYTTIQGTSMSGPHVAAVAALIVASNSEARKNPDKVLEILQKGARKAKNQTPPLDPNDTSPGDRTGVPCTGDISATGQKLAGYCHLGGPAISNREAYGAGIVDAWGSVKRGDKHDDADAGDDEKEDKKDSKKK